MPSPATIQNTEDAIKALRLRGAGYSVDQIAEHLDRSVVQIRGMIKKAIEELGLLKLEAADQLRGMEAARLDRMLQAVWDKAEDGSLAHISVVLKIMERRAKLLALDMRPDEDQSGDKFIVVPAWAARPDQEVIDGEWRKLEPGEQEAIMERAESAGNGPERAQEPLRPHTEGSD